MVYGADLESLSPVTGTGGSNPPFSFFNSHLMKKIIILNLIFLIFVFFAFDYFIFCQARQKYGLEMSYYENLFKKNKSANKCISFYSSQIPYRKPENKNSTLPSIYITGCSYAYGFGLEEDETLSAKLGHLIKNPVYNKAFHSWGLNHTVFLAKNDILLKDNIKDPLAVFFLYGMFQDKRMFMPNVFFERDEILYKVKGDKLIPRKNIFHFQSSNFPLIYTINERFFNILAISPFFKKRIEEMLFFHFKTLKEEINKKYPTTKLVILEYSPSQTLKNISDDLAKENIQIISFSDDLKLNLNQRKYYIPNDGHPNKQVWEIVTPKLIKELEKRNIDITEK